jgi:riboflavin biosynthesis pyrimidine reductase
VVTSSEADPARVGALRDAGAEVLAVPGSNPADRISATLADLGHRTITSVFLEGGRTLASAFIAADQVDESRTFIAPMLLGDDRALRRAGPVAAGDPPPPAVAKASSGAVPPTAPPARLTPLGSTTERVGGDTLIRARYKEW